MTGFTLKQPLNDEFGSLPNEEISRRLVPNTYAATINIAQNLVLPLCYRFAYLEVTVRADAERWEEWYMQTIMEVNGQKMPERISATRRAIARRLRDLEHDSDHHAERHEIESALRALSILEGEVQDW